MLCPNCGGNNLTDKRESVGNPYDFKKEREKLYGTNTRAASDLEARYFAEKKMKEVEATPHGGLKIVQDSTRHCPLCGYSLRGEWKFCPECGVSLIKK